MNKREVEYNTSSLVAVWLNGIKSITDLRLVFSHDTETTIIPCKKEECAKKIADILCDNKLKYDKVVLRGIVNKIDKELGCIEIK